MAASCGSGGGSDFKRAPLEHDNVDPGSPLTPEPAARTAPRGTRSRGRCPPRGCSSKQRVPCSGPMLAAACLHGTLSCLPGAVKRDGRVGDVPETISAHHVVISSDESTPSFCDSTSRRAVGCRRSVRRRSEVGGAHLAIRRREDGPVLAEECGRDLGVDGREGREVDQLGYQQDVVLGRLVVWIRTRCGVTPSRSAHWYWDCRRRGRFLPRVAPHREGPGGAVDAGG